MAHTYYNYLAYLQPDADVNLAVLKDSLEKLYETAVVQPLISVSQQQLTLTLEAFNFYITFSEAPHVQQEAQEFADEYELDWNEEPFDEQKLRACKGRFEIWADQDEDMDYFNDSLFIMETITSFDGAIAFSLD